MNTKNIVGLFLLIFLAQGCAIQKAARLPSLKNLEVIKVGAHRSEIIAEIGNPVASEETDFGILEFYIFDKGVSSAGRALRTAAHVYADMLTFGVWEAVGTPLEAETGRRDVKLQLVFTKQKQLSEIIPLNDLAKKYYAPQAESSLTPISNLGKYNLTDSDYTYVSNEFGKKLCAFFGEDDKIIAISRITNNVGSSTDIDIVTKKLKIYLLENSKVKVSSSLGEGTLKDTIGEDLAKFRGSQRLPDYTLIIASKISYINRDNKSEITVNFSYELVENNLVVSAHELNL